MLLIILIKACYKLTIIETSDSLPLQYIYEANNEIITIYLYYNSIKTLTTLIILLITCEFNEESMRRLSGELSIIKMILLLTKEQA